MTTSNTPAAAQSTVQWLWIGQLLSNLGTQTSLYGMGLWMFQRQGRVADFALVALVVQLARILALPMFGRWLPLWPPRLVMVVANSTGGFCTLALATLLLLQNHSLGLAPVLLFQAIAAMAEAALVLSLASLMPRLLPGGPKLERANGRLASSDGIAASVAPFLGSWLVGWSGLRGVFLVDATTFAIALLCVLAAPWPRSVSAVEQTHHREDERRQNRMAPLAPRLRGLAWRSATVALVYGVTEILYPPWITLSFGSRQMGTVLTVGLLGYALGLSWWHWVGARQPHNLLRLGLSLQGVVLLGLSWPGVPQLSWLWISGQMIFSALLPISLAALQCRWCACAPANELAPVMAVRYGCDWIARVSAFALCSVTVDQLVTPALTWTIWPTWLQSLLGSGQQRALALAMALAGLLLLLTALARLRPDER